MSVVVVVAAGVEVGPIAGGFSVSEVVEEVLSLGGGVSLGVVDAEVLGGAREVGVVDDLAGAGEDSSSPFCANPVVENIATAKKAESRSDRFKESREVTIVRGRVENSVCRK